MWKIKTQNGGELFSLDDSLRLGGGGEGAIYRVPGDDSRAIKVYYPDKMDPQQPDKLKAMLANPPRDPMRDRGHASIAWPEDLVVLQDTGRVCGFVMPRLRDGYAILKFFDVGFRQANLPLFTYRSLCRIARNLVSAVWALHEKGYVVGDVNERNIMATDKALVTIVDTDSFQVKDNGSGRVFRCLVRTDLYTPPEFQDVFLDQVDRSPAQDLFGIGVLLFQLLMEGYLPYAGVSRDPGKHPEGVECLKRGYFPYVSNQNGITPPPWAPPYSMLHPVLQKLFSICFVDGYRQPQSRPNAETWHRALKECEMALVSCGVNSRHQYFSHCKSCPWCERTARFKAAGQSTADPFPQAGSVSTSSRSKARHGGTQQPFSTPPLHPGVSAPAVSAGFSRTSTATPPAAATSMPPTPVALNPVTVELNAPIALQSAQLRLLKTIPLKQVPTPLLSPMRLNNHVPLDGYRPLNDISVELNYAAVGS